MRRSRFFMPLLKETPAEAQIVSHRLMLRAGLIKQQSAGIYSWLPLGFRVLRKVQTIVEQEMDRAGAVELLMPTLQSADLWKESGRYEAYGKEMLRIKDRHDRDLLYGPTNEEMVTDVFRTYVRSYKDLPLNLYHVQWKFRDEIRPRFGVMRGREFLMKDAYSFDIDGTGARKAYQRMFVAYLRAFDRMGIKAVPMRADTGPIGGDLSHEFIILAETGESQVFCHRDLVEMPVPGDDIDYFGDLEPIIAARTGLYAATEEKHDPAAFDALPKDKQMAARGIEVGHIFYFGTKYSKAMNAKVAGPDGQDVLVEMGSYGIGVSRLVGAIIEASHDESGIVWPRSVAPFDAGLISLKPGDSKADAACADLYAKLSKVGVEVLYDDTEARAGEKFAAMDLIGLPWQIIVGPRGLEKGVVEVKHRASGAREELGIDAAVAKLAG